MPVSHSAGMQSEPLVGTVDSGYLIFLFCVSAPDCVCVCVFWHPAVCQKPPNRFPIAVNDVKVISVGI